GIGCITADLPQGNDLAGIKRHDANFDCRTCFAHQNQLTDSHFDYLSGARFRQITDCQYTETIALPTMTAREQQANKYGLSLGPRPSVIRKRLMMHTMR
ncbi:10226_t:CDS:1, partial [Paraglomus occultum]